MIPLGVLASSYVAPAGGAGVEYLGILSDTANAESYTFADAPLGAATSDRVIVAVVMARPTAARAAVTIGGVSAVLDQGYSGTGSSEGRAEIWRAAVPTGTTGDIVVTMPTGDPADGCAVAIYAITGYTVTVKDTDESKDNAPSVTLDTDAGGLCIATRFVHYLSGHTSEWTGVTEDYDGSYGDDTYSGGHAYPTAAGTLTVTTTSSNQYSPRAAFATYTLS